MEIIKLCPAILMIILTNAVSHGPLHILGFLDDYLKIM